MLDRIAQELARLSSSLERKGIKTRAADYSPPPGAGQWSWHYTGGSPHPRGYTSDKRWEDRRQALFRKRSKACENCRGTFKIQVHHRRYFRGRAAWEYDDSDLCVLCRICHALVHGLVEEARDELQRSRLKKARYAPARRTDDEDFGRDEDFLETSKEGLDPYALYDEDNPELWRMEYIDDPEGRSDWLRSTGDDESEDPFDSADFE